MYNKCEMKKEIIAQPRLTTNTNGMNLPTSTHRKTVTDEHGILSELKIDLKSKLLTVIVVK